MSVQSDSCDYFVGELGETNNSVISTITTNQDCLNSAMCVNYSILSSEKV